MKKPIFPPRPKRVLLLIGFFLVGVLPLGPSFSQEGAPTAPPASWLGQGEYTGVYWPTQGWQTCKPEAVGVNSERLLEALKYAADPAFRSQGLLIVRKGYIIAEAYLWNFKKDSRHVSHSMAKSVTSALVGIAIDQGRISGLDERICPYLEGWDCDDLKDPRSRITIRHALTLTTGLMWQEDWSRFDPTQNDALQMHQSGRYVRYMSQRPGKYEPGRRFNYSTGDPMLLSPVIQKAVGKTVLSFAQETLFGPLGMEDIVWEKDADGFTATAWGLYATLRDYAKFGYLFLRKGIWEEKRIISKEWVEKSTRPDGSVQGWAAYGYLWHVRLPLRLAVSGSPFAQGLPADGFMAEGVLGQCLVVIPSLDLVIVRLANQTGPAMDLARFLAMVLRAVKD